MKWICSECISILCDHQRLASAAQQFLQGLVPMMNTPNSAPTSALQSIGTICWPFQKGMLAIMILCEASQRGAPSPTLHLSNHA